VRVFDCGRAPCKGRGRNQPNRQNARISHRRALRRLNSEKVAQYVNFREASGRDRLNEPRP
jgi:hypothetical protein